MELTLNIIDAYGPCTDGRKKMLATLGKTEPDDTPVTLLEILDSNGLMDALWVLDRTECDLRLARHFSAWCAEQVLHLFEAERPDDMRPRNAIAIARDDNAPPAAAAAAAAAAGDAAGDAWAAARAARAAAWSAGDAAWAAAWDAAWAAAWDAARAARDAARAARDAARAARDAARAARDAQTRQFRTMLLSGEYHG